MTAATWLNPVFRPIATQTPMPAKPGALQRLAALADLFDPPNPTSRGREYTKAHSLTTAPLFDNWAKASIGIGDFPIRRVCPSGRHSDPG